MPNSRILAAESLGDEIAVLSSAIYAAEARLLERIYAFDVANYYETLGFPSTAHWLNYRCGVGMTAARERVRVAKCLQELPEIRAAFGAGMLSYSKVRAMTRVATPETDEYLLMLGTYATAHQIERLVAKTSRAKRSQDEAEAEVVYENRYLSVFRDESGAFELKGRFPAEQGAMIVKALELAMEQDFRSRSGDSAETSNSDDSAGTSAQPGPTQKRTRDVPAETPRTFRQRRADALADLAETFLAHPGDGSRSGDRFQVVVHVSAGTSQGSSPDVPAESSWMEDAGHLPRETARRLGCDCSLLAVTEDERGEPLSIGRKSRSIPPAIRRALQLRDGGCRFPGCTHTRYVDGHHILHWADGGETSLDNLVLLCRYHHRLVHEGGFDCSRTADGEILFTDTGRKKIPAGIPLPGFGDDLDAWIDRQVFDHDIDQDSCKAKMDATDRMDYCLASEPLLPLPAEWLSSPTTTV